MSDEEYNTPFPQLNEVLAAHRDWLTRMPWAEADKADVASLRKTVDKWIDEFTEQFLNDGNPLSSEIDVVACWQRVFNLLSGPCLAFVQHTESRSSIYQKVATVLRRHTNTTPVATGISDVRDSFREFGRNDGVRHCVLATAVQAGHETAIDVFREEFDGVRRQLTSAFASRLSENAVDEVWQDVLTDLAFGGVSGT
jgi:hypothetical protein